MLVRLLKALDGGGFTQVESMHGVAKRLVMNLDATDDHPAAAEQLKELLLLKGCLAGGVYAEAEKASYVAQYSSMLHCLVTLKFKLSQLHHYAMLPAFCVASAVKVYQQILLLLNSIAVLARVSS